MLAKHQKLIPAHRDADGVIGSSFELTRGAFAKFGAVAFPASVETDNPCTAGGQDNFICIEVGVTKVCNNHRIIVRAAFIPAAIAKHVIGGIFVKDSSLCTKEPGSISVHVLA